MSYAEKKVLKKKLDAEKLERFETASVKHIYSAVDWVQWTGNNYIKSNYDVLTPDGTIHPHCRPNAGKMISYRGNLEWDEHADIKVRLSETFPY